MAIVPPDMTWRPWRLASPATSWRRNSLLRHGQRDTVWEPERLPAFDVDDGFTFDVQRV
jgi:hypothetical protein